MDRKSKKPSTTEEESYPISIGGAVEGLLDASKVRVEVAPTHPLLSPSTEKRQLRTTARVDALGGISAEEVGNIRREGIIRPSTTPVEQDTLKFIIFNIHGTLLNCSLLREKNPNPTMRTTLSHFPSSLMESGLKVLLLHEKEKLSMMWKVRGIVNQLV